VAAGDERAHTEHGGQGHRGIVVRRGRRSRPCEHDASRCRRGGGGPRLVAAFTAPPSKR
jgi:hypothetical protein